jgi:hypothetical protein
MTTPSTEDAILGGPASLRLRAPEPAFAALGAVILFGLGLLLAAWAGSGLVRFEIAAMQALTLPVALAATLACVTLWRRLKRGVIGSRYGIVWRVASAFGAMGLAWPLSFGLSALLQGDTNTALVQCAAALITAAVGAIIGAIAGAAAAWACTVSARSKP